VFSPDFFVGEFAQRLREFSKEQGDANVRVEVITLTGERIDTLLLRTLQTGARISTRESRLVFVPYPSIAYIEVAALEDHRIAGFRLSTSSD
jgi:hypothetical protein